MAQPRQRQHTDTEAVARGISPVDISGDASTISSDPLVAKDQAAQRSYARAVASAFTPQPGSSQSSSLLEAYKRWISSQQNNGADVSKGSATSSSKAATAAVERRAMKKSERHLAKRLRQGVSTTRALTLAHKRNTEEGGQLSRQTWSRKMAAG
jgi:biotin carboxylase